MNKEILSLMAFILLASLMALTSCTKSAPGLDTELPAVTTSVIIQDGNNLPKYQLYPRESQDIEDNWICTEMGGYEDGYSHPEWVYPHGFKWIRISTAKSPLNWQYVERETRQYFIDPTVNKTVDEYAKYDINIVLNLGIGNAETRPDTTRFKSEEDIERYCDYVQCVVREFKNRIEYYEIWNEPNIPEEHAPHGGIALEDYVRLIKQAATVIRQEYPNAKIVIGAVGGLWLPDYPGYGDTLRHTLDIDYLHRLLESGVATMVDVISWHPFYGNLADDPYYQSYPQIVEEIKQLATSEGFEGEYMVGEMVWRTADDPLDVDLPRFSECIVAKYYARSIITHRGLDIITGIALHSAHDTIHNLCTIMAGAEPIYLPVEIQSEVTDILSYGFSIPKGDKLLALWINGVPVDEDPGIVTSLTLSDSSVQKVVGIDVLNSFEQELITSIEGGNLVIHNLLVKDYPIILRLAD